MPALVDQFCLQLHDAPITAAACDGESLAWATADATGHIRVARSGETTARLHLRLGTARIGALGILRGGALLAAGDDAGTIAVFDLDTGEEIFREEREGQSGRGRAMRGVALSPEGVRLAAIALDGLIRIWDIERGVREIAWNGFGGQTVEFDGRGERLLCVDAEGQPRLVDIRQNHTQTLARVAMHVERAVFSPEGTHIIAGGAAGLALLRVVDGSLLASFVARHGSGLVALVVEPGGERVAAVSPRSAHEFTLPDLAPAASLRHGAPAPEAAFWGPEGIEVGGSDGTLHRGEDTGPGPVTAVAGFGGCRLAGHDDRVVVWQGTRRGPTLGCAGAIELTVDRDLAHVAAILPTGLVVYELRTGAHQELGVVQPGSVTIGGALVGALLPRGGGRWWDLSRKRETDLPEARALAVSYGGTWVAQVDSGGRVHVLDPSTSRAAIPDPLPPGEAPIRLVGFVNRRPDLLTVDAEHILTWYDLAVSVRENRPVEGQDVLQFSSPPDRIWGITGGRLAAVRIPEGDRCTILFADLEARTAVAEVVGLDPRAVVDAEAGLILEPARGSAVLERGMDGAERRVFRSLAQEEWLCFGASGILDSSPGATGVLGRG